MPNTDPNRPNILFICTDRQRWDTLGCYGNEWVTTPNLDKLAGDGVCFEQAWCQNPICAPSRASFLTGRYPRTTRINRNGQRLPKDEKLISKLLAESGYVCGHSGKFHLAPASPPIADWGEPRGDDGYSIFDWSMHVPAKPVSGYDAWLSEHDIEFKREPVKDSKYVEFGMDEKTSNTAWVTQRAINFAKVSAKYLDRPWFFTLNINDPHSPIDPPKRFLEPYLERLDEIPLPKYTPGELDNKPDYQKTDRGGVYGGGNKKQAGSGSFAAQDMTDDDHRLIKAGYFAMMDHVDYQVGRLIDTLKETGQYENTIIIFTCDHGEMLGEHGMYFQGPYFYEPMMHVPLVMKLPDNIKQGFSVPDFVELVDLAPTLMEAAGLEVYEGMQGKSLWHLLTEKASKGSHREDVYFEYYRAIPLASYNGGGYITGVRNKQWALSAVHDRDGGELYDLVNDPGEVNNLWDDPKYIKEKADMLKRLCDRMAQTIDPLPVTEAGY